jgi:hypothetical protein
MRKSIIDVGSIPCNFNNYFAKPKKATWKIRNFYNLEGSLPPFDRVSGCLHPYG